MPPSYDPVVETVPGFPVELENALLHARITATDAHDVMKKLEPTCSSDPEFVSLKKEIYSHCIRRKTNTRTIAVLGNTGEGKSSLINSLLHVQGLAPESSSRACTSIVTEYHQRLPGQTDPFVIEVEYMNDAKRKEHIRELLWSYRRVYLPDIDENEIGAEELRKLENESEVAWSTLRTAFRHEHGFNKAFLEDLSDGAWDRILAKLVEWSDNIQWPHGDTPGHWKTTAQTVDECRDETWRFTEDRYWPFTEIIRIYLNSSILDSGIVLADLPGLKDVNLARFRATQNYLIRCDSILIVGRITRAVSDASMQSALYLSLKKHAPSSLRQGNAPDFKVAFVCTHSEEFNIRSAIRELPDGDLKTNLNRLQRSINLAQRAGDRLREWDTKLEGLTEAYTSEMGEGQDLSVFCVSNTWYDEYTLAGNRDLITESQIPALRTYCRTISVDAQMAETKQYLHCEMPELLTSLGLWASSAISRQTQAASMVGSADVLKKVNDFKTELHSLTTQFETDCKDNFYEELMTYFSHYNAWCLNNGEHSAPKKDYTNWNAKINWKMRSEIEYPWDLVEELTQSHFDEFEQALSGRLMKIKEYINSLQAAPDRNRLVDLIGLNYDTIKYALARKTRKTRKDLKAIRFKSCEATALSYIVDEMIPAYREASVQYGTGKRNRQEGIIQGHLMHGDIFLNLGSRLSRDVHTVLEGIRIFLKHLIDDIFGKIERGVRLAYGTQATTLPRHNAELESSLCEFLNSVTQLQGQHQSTMSFVQQYMDVDNASQSNASIDG
ncbi:hypothetical protein SEUCBS140593_003572 [Sporothrix eucalyptigena]|uniref:Uncharacterized protein n=1 Tax=Sporothrix eucalyptigena TaxID=1812306 RepID=A0ABP0BG30_9PEZI